MMSKAQVERRLQREFLFVFGSEPRRLCEGGEFLKTNRIASEETKIQSAEDVQLARSLLLDELREFGC